MTLCAAQITWIIFSHNRERASVRTSPIFVRTTAEPLHHFSIEPNAVAFPAIHDVRAPVARVHDVQKRNMMCDLQTLTFRVDQDLAPMACRQSEQLQRPTLSDNDQCTTTRRCHKGQLIAK